MSAITRRTLFSSAVPAIGALALTTLAPAAAAPDAELLSLGLRFSDLMPEFLTVLRESNRLHTVWKDAVAQAGIHNCAGLPPKQNRIVDRLGETTGYYPVNDRADGRCHELVRLSELIRRHQPTTIAGLAVWARAAQFEAADLGDPKEAYAASDCVSCQIFDLVAQIERMAEVSHG